MSDIAVLLTFNNVCVINSQSVQAAQMHTCRRVKEVLKGIVFFMTKGGMYMYVLSIRNLKETLCMYTHLYAALLYSPS